MEQPYPFQPNLPKPAIYSPRVVSVLSMLFSGLAGGVLTYYSLQAVGQLRGAQRALRLSIMFVVLLLGLSMVLPLRSAGTGLSIGLGYGWGYYLNEFFLKKYLPDETIYPRKSWVKPLLIWLAVIVGLFGFAGAMSVI